MKASALALVITAAACLPAKQPAQRAQVRAAIVAVAAATYLADEVCADVARSQMAMGDREGAFALATRCSEAYAAGREALIAAEEATAEGRPACKLAAGVDALDTVLRALRSAGVETSEAAADARAFAMAMLRAERCEVADERS